MLVEYTRFPRALTSLPMVDVTLRHTNRKVTLSALVDSGAMMSTLPHDIGVQLGLVWEEQHIDIAQAGQLQGVPAKGIALSATVGDFPKVRLAFALIRKASFEVRPILGQMNFFREFTITFEGYNNSFDIRPKPTNTDTQNH